MYTLNAEQKLAVSHTKGPLLVLAGAGSGKTRIVTCRIAELIASGVAESEIVAVTFTNKAAEEMKRRLQALVGDKLPIVCTFHALGARILRESIPELGYSANFTIYDEENSSTLLKRCLQSMNLKLELDEIKAMRRLISSAKNLCLEPKQISEQMAEQYPPHFQVLYELYETRLREAQAVDFDDLLYLTVRLFKEKPNVLADYHARWHYLLIDEYQDTNQAQYCLANQLIEKSRNLFVVGDPDQAIYSWRGANIRNILSFEKDYPGARVVRLEQNYRSSPTILQAANNLIANNRSRYPKNLWSERTSGEKIQLFVAHSERQEAEFVAEEIYSLHTKLTIPYREMAILYRTNFQSRSFEDLLLRHRIPYTIVGGLSFYHRKEIKDILAFLQMIVSDHDYIAFLRTIHLPKRGIGEVALEKIRQGAKAANCSLVEFIKRLVNKESELKLAEKQRESLKEYLDIILALRALATQSPLNLQNLLLHTIASTRYVEQLQTEKESFEERKANLDELVGKAAEYDLLTPDPQLPMFLEELTLKSTLDELGDDIDRLPLMTLHHGKGLEFSAVFLVGMEEDLCPHANAKNSMEAIEEERRLCYVGMTRAKERLYLTAAENRFLWGNFRKMRPSRFLREIPRDYFERIQ